MLAGDPDPLDIEMEKFMREEVDFDREMPTNDRSLKQNSKNVPEFAYQILIHTKVTHAQTLCTYKRYPKETPSGLP